MVWGGSTPRVQHTIFTYFGALIIGSRLRLWRVYDNHMIWTFRVRVTWGFPEVWRPFLGVSHTKGENVSRSMQGFPLVMETPAGEDLGLRAS